MDKFTDAQRCGALRAAPMGAERRTPTRVQAPGQGTGVSTLASTVIAVSDVKSGPVSQLEPVAGPVSANHKVDGRRASIKPFSAAYITSANGAQSGVPAWSPPV